MLALALQALPRVFFLKLLFCLVSLSVNRASAPQEALVRIWRVAGCKVYGAEHCQCCHGATLRPRGHPSGTGDKQPGSSPEPARLKSWGSCSKVDVLVLV